MNVLIAVGDSREAQRMSSSLFAPSFHCFCYHHFKLEGRFKPLAGGTAFALWVPRSLLARWYVEVGLAEDPCRRYLSQT